MIPSLITLLIIALVLYVVFYIAGLFIQGTIHKIIGAILALVFLLYALKTFGIVLP